MTAVLGISAFYHDSAAALVVDGRLVVAAQEERFTRKRHDSAFPANAIAWCLEAAGIDAEHLDYIGFYDKPLLKFERLLETYLSYAPAGYGSFSAAIPVWLREKLFLRRAMRQGIAASQTPLVFLEHHESHAASAFFPSPYDSAAILTVDGVGEWSTATLGTGEGNQIRLTHQLKFPHSLGLLYSTFTYYCGFRVNSGEYKLMGLAPYGQPVYAEDIKRHLIDIKPDGSLWLNMKYFNYCQGLTMTNRRFHRHFGGPPRKPESRLEQRHMDLAASIQAVTEEVMLRMASHLHRLTKARNLVLAGGVALNCVANGRILREGPFDSIWIQPAAGDAGGALGAALFIWHQLLQKPRRPEGRDSQQGSLLGPAYSSVQVRRFLDGGGIGYEVIDDEHDLLETTASLIAEEKVVGWFQGRMEFGPRALGSRSILGDPRSATMQTTMNRTIKYRESFRPFAPAVMREHAADWFELDPRHESPYMLLVAPVHRQQRVAPSAVDLSSMMSDPDLCRRVNVVRSSIPAVTHVDYSARLQTVDEERNPRFYRLLKTFHRMTGCPVLINTSFNVRGEPIVCTPADAYRCFLATEIDVLVIENCLVRKSPSSRRTGDDMRDQHLAQFQLD